VEIGEFEEGPGGSFLDVGRRGGGFEDVIEG